MYFFKHFPYIKYEDRYLITDLFKRFRLSPDFISGTSFYEWYIVKDGETPEALSKRFYGSEKYTWVILLANGMFDRYEDWILSDKRLLDYINFKYGEDSQYETHHYETQNDVNLPDGIWVDADYDGVKIAITNWEYEMSENEKKREIMVILPNVVGDIEKSLVTYMKNASRTE